MNLALDFPLGQRLSSKLTNVTLSEDTPICTLKFDGWRLGIFDEAWYLSWCWFSEFHQWGYGYSLKTSIVTLSERCETSKGEIHCPHSKSRVSPHASW